jgi:hypothetical protein
MIRKLALAVAVALLPLSTVAQTVDTSALSPAEQREKDALEFLRETQVEVNGLRLVENRISFASDLAAMLWNRDEREARILYSGVLDDFRQLISQVDSQSNLLGPKPADGDVSETYSMFEPSERQKIARRFTVVSGVRQAIAANIAEHDPELALTFYYETLGSVSNPDFKKVMAQSDPSLEKKLIDRLAVFDPAKAAAMARKTLDTGFKAQQVDMLRQLYAKDADTAADLAASYLSKVKSERPEALDLAAVSSLLKYGTQMLDQSRTISGTRAIYSDSDLRDLAETLSQAVLSRPTDTGASLINYARDVERYQPARAVQIRSRAQAQTQTRMANIRTVSSAPPATFRGPVNANVTGNGAVFAVANSPEQLARVQREANEKKLMDDITKVSNPKISADQREKTIAQLRKTIAATPGKDKKIIALSALAGQVVKSGDKDLAAEIMRDAAAFVNPQPKNYQDFLLSWMLAAGYASVEPERSFVILDELIGRCNEVIVAAIRTAEFVDTNDEIVVDGELQIGGFASGPGSAMVKGLTTSLSGFDSVLMTLAKADFQKTRELTNRFERPEARVLAKMLVLRAVLGDKTKPAPKTNPAVH